MTVAFLRRVQIFLLIYLLTYSCWLHGVVDDDVLRDICVSCREWS